MTCFVLSYELFADWVILHVFLSSVDFFLELTFLKKSFRNSIRVLNIWNPDQALHFDLGPNHRQRLSADDKSRYQQGKT